MTTPVPEIGEVLGSYRLESLLGRGGMGAVYLASHTHLAKHTAIKILAPELAADAVCRSRFLTEARLISEIDAPGVVDIIDLVEQEEPPRIAYVMEYIDGPTLRRELYRIAFTPVQAAQIGVQLVRALEAIHEKSVIHRDIKPSNILFTGRIEADTNTVPRVKLVDFGIAKAQDRPAPHQTATGLIVGTPAYMAPEQVTGEPTSWETDVYALGEVLHEMFTRRRVFPENQRDAFRMKLQRQPPEIEPFPFAGGTAVAAVVRRCLEPEFAKRPSHRELLEQLTVVAGSSEAIAVAPGEESPLSVEQTRTLNEVPLDIGPPTPLSISSEPERPPTFVAEPRSWMTVFFLAGVALAAGLGLGALWSPSPDAADDRVGEAVKLGLSPKKHTGVLPAEPTPGARRTADVPSTAAEFSAASAIELDADALEKSVRPGSAAPAPVRAGPPPKAPPPSSGRASSVVEVEIRSRPTGAKVSDPQSGLVLGRTPMRVEVEQGRGGEVRLSRRGYRTRTFVVDGRAKREVVALEARVRLKKRGTLDKAASPRKRRQPPAPRKDIKSEEELLPW